MGYVLGIDGGGTKTVCVLINSTGEVVGRGEAGPSNYQTVGLDTAGQSIAIAIKRAVHPEIGFSQIEAIGLGLAGVGRPEDQVVVHSMVQQLPYRHDDPVELKLPPERVFVTHDCAIALAGGTHDNVGIVTVSGTGSIAYGRNREGITKRVGGWGYLLGDEGSGYDIALQGLRAVMRAYDGRQPATGLSTEVMEALNLKSLEDLIEIVYRSNWKAKDIAALAPLVHNAAIAGDSTANQIIDQTVDELVLIATVVCESLFDDRSRFEVVTMGGIWSGMPNIRDRFEQQILAKYPRAEVIWPLHEPAYGAGMLALEN
jgi:N-acetylglucosamine kinase-like BadF-type ATPase